jgi:hypothetical protein
VFPREGLAAEGHAPAGANYGRQIRANTPIRIIAVGHDSSVAMIERHYSAELAHFVDDIARAALLDTGTRRPPSSLGDNIVPIRTA